MGEKRKTQRREIEPTSERLPLPSAREINPFDDLDGIEAEKHFLGKSIDEAERLLAENFSRYQEDLMFMGPVAFRYYLPAAIRYLKSYDDRLFPQDDFAMLATLKYRWELERKELLPVRDQMLAYCRAVIDRAKQADLWPQEVYLKLTAEFQEFVAVLTAASDII